jgi:hypothetical protein
MKITDDMLTEMEPIVSQWIRERGTCMDGASYAAALELAAYVAARRTTPDREAIIEECRQVALQRSVKLPHDDDLTRGYANGRIGAAADIARLKTSSTSDQGEKS